MAANGNQTAALLKSTAACNVLHNVLSNSLIYMIL